MARTGERKQQILQTLAAMLENPKSERITTALLAARLDVSEAALYRHFASKAQMFEGLIEFIEQSVFTLVNQILERDSGTDLATGEYRVIAYRNAARSVRDASVSVAELTTEGRATSLPAACDCACALACTWSSIWPGPAGCSGVSSWPPPRPARAARGRWPSGCTSRRSSTTDRPAVST